MSNIGLKGLQGLNRINKADAADKRQFFAKNKNVFDQFSGNFALQRQLMDIAYNDHKFRKAFNLDQTAFDDISNRYSYDQRVALYNSWDAKRRDKAIMQGAIDNYAPFDGKKFNPNKGFGSIDQWNIYSEMSPKGWKRLMESDWKSPAEMEKLKADTDKAVDIKNNSHQFIFGAGAQQNVGDSSWESWYQKEKEKNDKILTQIYNDDLEDQAQQLEKEVSNAYYTYLQKTPSDNAVRKRFNSIFVDENSDMVKMHKGQYAAHLHSAEMKDFSIDDMRKAIAKWDTYTKYMSPYAAGTVLNNEAQRYIANHQSGWEKTKAYVGDFIISTLSYTADKANGFVNAGYGTADLIDGGLDSYVDNNTNEVVDANKVFRDTKDGHLFYYDDKGKSHRVHKTKIARTALRNMGKNLDGSENKGFLWDGDIITLNPQYWSRAEQYGTLNEDEQKQLEQLGASPHTVAYNPNEEGNFWWEVFKMGTFGLADMVTALIPIGGGIGLAGKGFSALSKVGKATNYFSRAMNWTGKALINNSQKIAQFSQGTAGALGIAYAYNRGAFQETLEKNLGNAEEAVQERANSYVADRYNTDAKYRSHYDSLVNAKAATLKRKYLNNLKNSDGDMQLADMNAVDKLVKSQAEAQVQQEEEAKAAEQFKKTPEYAQLQDKAIDEAGDAAFNTFWPEAIKYGLINTVGFRKWLYTNPTGLKTKLSSSLKGLKEITTKGGRQRLATKASKFLTSGEKWKQFTKTTGSQILNGAWTNGTDDMMTDAAERMSDDSYNRYINGFLNGEAVADTYGLADGMYTFMRNANSYINGLSNSLGQETTWNATKVGAFGSVFSGNLNFVNLGRLATKKGREAYRKTFQERYQRDDDGIIRRDEQGNPLTEKVSWRENWRDRAAYFIQNGILNTYYGKKQAERDLQSHADFLNNLLDDANDFEDITGLIASDNGLEGADGVSDEKTMRFIKALKTAKTLASLGNNNSDPARMSSVVQNAKALMEQAAQIKFDPEKDDVPQDALSQQLIKTYYAVNNNADNPHSDDTDRKALATVIKNSKDFQEAAEAYDTAEKELQKAERTSGQTFRPVVRERLKLNHALNNHWQQRLDTMKDEIGDTSEAGELVEQDIIPSLGSKKNAEDLVSVYDRQEKDINTWIGNQQKEVDEAKKKYDQAVEELSKHTNDDLTHEMQQKVIKAKAKYDNEALHQGYLQEMLAITKRKRKRVSDALEATKEEGYKDKVLTADEIMALDPVTRARMLRNNDIVTEEMKKAGKKTWREEMYSPEQIAEIEKLEKQLTMKDADALQKIQDIALLTQRIETNKDAYNKVLQNPEAAAEALEAQRNAAAERGYAIINQRNAQTIANLINDAENSTKGFKDLSQEGKEREVFNTLKRLNPFLLDIIDSDHLLPQYLKQVADAKDWQSVIGDLDAVISRADKDDAWKENISKHIDVAEMMSGSRDELLSNLEKAIDNSYNDESVRAGLDYVLQGMETLGYHRDTTTLENRAKRKDREEKEKAEAAKREAEEKALKDKVAKAAADEKADREAEAAKKAAEREAEENAYTEHPVSPTGEELVPTAEVDEGKQAEDAEKAGEGETLDLHITPSTLMESDAEEGTIEAGQMWHGEGSHASQEGFTVTMKKNVNNGERTITFTTGKTGDTLYIAPGEWSMPKHDPYITVDENLIQHPVSENTTFEAHTLFDDSHGNWYFKGGFLGRNGEYTVKATDKFNLDKAIERQNSAREAALAAQGVDTSNKNLTVYEDQIGSRTETLEEQIKDAEKEGERQYSSDENVDSEKVNDTTEATMEHTETTLTGNTMSEYVIVDMAHPDQPSLKNGGVLVHKKGSKEGDSMNRYYAWMEHAGIHLQNIVDTELYQVLEQNPHTKIKFMYVNPSGKGTDDAAMKSHLMLVVDYDDKVNKGITTIHDDDNGGVIKSHGKEYLIVGVAGYGAMNMGKRDLYDILMSNNPRSPHGYGMIRTGSKKYFDAHPEERYYVNDDITTEVVYRSLIPGYIVKQLEKDDHAEYRDISEVLKDKDRNPDGLSLGDLAWGIQEQTQFMVVFPEGAEQRKVLIPRRGEDNMGRAFVLIPASNGALIPSYVKPLFYADAEGNGSVMREGRLKDEVYENLNKLTAQDNHTRVDGIIGLSKIFYFDNDKGDGILTTRDGQNPVVSFLHNGQVFASFNLDSPTFDRQQLFDAFATMNPRVNITHQVLANPSRLEVYDEAGALQTDVALLHTAGASYSIHAVDANGNMIEEAKTPENTSQTAPSQEDFRKDSRQVVFKHNLYTYKDGKYYLNGKEVTDAKELKQLEYNRRIFVENELVPSASQGIWNTFILSKGEHPEVVSVNKNTYEVKEVPEAEAKALIEKLDKKHEDKERENAAEDALETGKREDVELGDLTDNTTSDTTVEHTTPADNTVREKAPTVKNEEAEQDFDPETGEVYDKFNPKKSTPQPSAPPVASTKGTQTFTELRNNPKYQRRITMALMTKWKDAPKDADKLMDYLRSKHVEVDAIGTTDEDIEAWLKTNIECR